MNVKVILGCKRLTTAIKTVLSILTTFIQLLPVIWLRQGAVQLLMYPANHYWYQLAEESTALIFVVTGSSQSRFFFSLQQGKWNRKSCKETLAQFRVVFFVFVFIVVLLEWLQQPFLNEWAPKNNHSRTSQMEWPTWLP